MNLHKITNYSLLILISFNFVSCKQNIFLSQKYFYGKHFHQKDNTKQLNLGYNNNAHSKKNNIEVLCSNKQNVNLDDKRVELLPTHKKLQKQGKSKAVFNKIFKSELATNGFNKFKLKQHAVYKSRHHEKISAKKEDDNSKFKGYLKAILLTLLFWVLAIVLYSNVLAVELASVLVTLQIIGVVLLAAIVWLIIHYLYTVLNESI